MHMKLSVRQLRRWKYVGGSANAARFSNVTIKGLVHLLACMRQGLQVHAGMPLPKPTCSKAHACRCALRKVLTHTGSLFTSYAGAPVNHTLSLVMLLICW